MFMPYQQPMLVPYAAGQRSTYRKRYVNYRKKNAYTAGRYMGRIIPKSTRKMFYKCNKKTLNPVKCFKKAATKSLKWKLEQTHPGLNQFRKIPRKGYMAYQGPNGGRVYFVKDTPRNRAAHPNHLLYVPGGVNAANAAMEQQMQDVANPVG